MVEEDDGGRDRDSDLVATLATDDDLHTVWLGAGPLGLEIVATPRRGRHPGPGHRGRGGASWGA